MPAEIVYEFDQYQLIPMRGRLLHNGEPRRLTPTAFTLLCVLVKNHGEVVSKTELMKSVWLENFVTDNNFNVTLAAVRRALNESGRNPTYIFKVGAGYRFVAEVREIAAGGDNRVIEAEAVPPRETIASAEDEGREAPEARTPAPKTSAHTSHVLFSSSLYGMLYGIALILEIAYRFDEYGATAMKIAPAVFIWMATSSAGALALDQRLTIGGRKGGLALSVVVFLVAAAALFATLTRFLPSVPITEATLQSYPAQAAYLKDISYFLLLAFCFLMLPFHFVVSIERDILRGKRSQVVAMLTGKKLAAPSGTLYVRPWMLAGLLVVLAGFSLALTSHLLDHLRLRPYTNLFTQLVYARALIYFALGLECVIWYAKTLNDLCSKARRSGSGTREKR